MITPDKIQQIKTAYSFLKPSPIYDLVEAVEELQTENQELKTICEAMVSTITDGWLDFAGPEGTINLPIKVSEFKRLKAVLEKQEKQ